MFTFSQDCQVFLWPAVFGDNVSLHIANLNISFLMWQVSCIYFSKCISPKKIKCNCGHHMFKNTCMLTMCSCLPLYTEYTLLQLLHNSLCTTVDILESTLHLNVCLSW